VEAYRPRVRLRIDQSSGRRGAIWLIGIVAMGPALEHVIAGCCRLEAVAAAEIPNESRAIATADAELG